ncbi:MAG: trigger factor, partial [Planctomycetota bacterium]
MTEEQNTEPKEQPEAPDAEPKDVRTPPEAPEAPPEAPPEAAEEAIEEAVEEPGEGLPESAVTIEDSGRLRKRFAIEVPRERIDAKFSEMFGELGESAQVPGFRIGRAPRRLIEKRFGKEVAEDVRNSLVGEAVGKALDDAEFRVLGEPDLKLDDISVPDDGPLTFDFEVEVAPDVTLPDYEGMEVRRPQVEVTDQHVDEALDELRRPRGTLRPTNKAAQEDDVIVADVSLTGEGIDVQAANAEVRVAPGTVSGIPLEGLGEALAGKKAGQAAELTTTVPAGHPNEAWRDKEVTISLKVQEVKRLELPELTDEFAAESGFESMEDMRDAVRSNLQGRVAGEQERLLADQVRQFFLDKVDLDVPEGVAQRQSARVLQRRVIDLMIRGVPREQIEQNLAQLEQQAAAQAAQDLKRMFIMDDLAETLGIEVEEDEVNARIAQIAQRYRRRPERMRREMQDDGTYTELMVAIREDKAV